MLNLSNTPVFYVDLPTELRGYTLASGGFGVSFLVSEEHRAGITPIIAEYAPEYSEALRVMAIGQVFVTVDKKIAEAIGQDSVNAILSHEEGHLVAGHHEILKKDIEAYSVNMDHELAADAYSAAIHGSKAVIRALRRLIIALGYEMKGRYDRVKAREIMKGDHFAARFNALKALA